MLLYTKINITFLIYFLNSILIVIQKIIKIKINYLHMIRIYS